MFTEILPPMLTLVLPLIGCRFQNCHIFRDSSARLLVGIDDDYSFLEQTGSFNFFGFNNDAMNSCRAFCDQIVKPCGRRTHADNNGHRLEFVVCATLDEFLHDSRSASRRIIFHAAMSLINNEINFIGLRFNRVL